MALLGWVLIRALTHHWASSDHLSGERRDVSVLLSGVEDQAPHTSQLRTGAQKWPRLSPFTQE